jgi:hypothetical protein
MGVWVAVAVAAGGAALCLAAYRGMIALKPRVARPAFGPAARAEVAPLRDRLRDHVQALGGRIGERHLGRPAALRAAAEYIRDIWERLGFSVTEEAFQVAGRPCANLWVEIRGSTRPEAVILVGAHYDSAPGSPGANDNGTGVGLLLEMSRALKAQSLPRTVRFVAFVNEEPPYFQTEAMGSRIHAVRARQRGDRIEVMLSLETLGYYADQPGSQRYPPPFGMFYPDRGNFLAVVGNLASRRQVVDFLRHFMAASDFPVEGVATFERIPGIDWSDHWSFWQEAYPALMLTDTAPFRYPEYHSAHDLPDRVNAHQFARAAHGIIQAVARLANAP